MLSFDYH